MIQYKYGLDDGIPVRKDFLNPDKDRGSCRTILSARGSIEKIIFAQVVIRFFDQFWGRSEKNIIGIKMIILPFKYLKEYQLPHPMLYKTCIKSFSAVYIRHE